ncbi:recombinase family protein [Thalassospira australica]|uniref:recombinase family protein n=1 Tax=Thalassospira australica TaxID=1528106 RepID=UPI00384FB306
MDTTTAVGKMFFHLIGMFAEFERNMISERTKARLEAAKQRGTYGTKPSISHATMQKAAMLYKKGFNWVAVAKAVGVSKSTIYNYRSEIEALMKADVEEELENPKPTD